MLGLGDTLRRRAGWLLEQVSLEKEDRNHEAMSVSHGAAVSRGERAQFEHFEREGRGELENGRVCVVSTTKESGEERFCP